MYNSNTSINNGNAMNFSNNSSSNQQFSQQSSTYQHHQQQVGSNPPQNNYHQSQQQQHPQLWTTDPQQTNNYHPQQPNNNSNGFASNNIGKGGADISNSNSFRGQTSNPAGNNPMPPSNASHQEVAGFSNQATTGTSNQVGQQSAVNPAWGDANASHQNVDQTWSQAMGPNWAQQTHTPNQLQTQVQPQQSSLQRTFDYVQQCQNWST